MSWETRRNGLRYYYEARKISGKVVKTYVGSEGSEWVCAAASLDRLAGDRRRANGQSVRAIRSLVESQAAAVDVGGYLQDVRRIEGAVIEACGYHRHNRGEWRRSRMNAKQGTQERTGPYRPQDTESSN